MFVNVRSAMNCATTNATSCNEKLSFRNGIINQNILVQTNGGHKDPPLQYRRCGFHITRLLLSITNQSLVHHTLNKHYQAGQYSVPRTVP